MIIIEFCKNCEDSKYIGPEDCNKMKMHEYIDKYGCHFNQKLLEYAESLMYKNGSQITPWTQLEVDNLLNQYGIKLNNNTLLDYVYVANMCKADFLGSSITSNEQVAKFIKDCIDDSDGYDGIIFCRWYADIRKNCIKVDWESMI